MPATNIPKNRFHPFLNQPRPRLWLPHPQPTPDPTANWKTYTNSKHGFAFKYPQDYKVEERVDGFIVITAPGEPAPQEGISIDVRLKGIYETFDKATEWVNTSLDVSRSTKIGDWNIYTGVGKEGMITGIEFRNAVIRYRTGAMGVETMNNEPYKNLFDQILSTFKFLD